MSIAQSVAGSVASSGASRVAGSGGGVVPVVNRFAQFNGTTDEAVFPVITHTINAGTLMVRCKLDVATPAAGAQCAIVEYSVASAGATLYPFTSGQAYVSTFRATRVGPFALSGAVTRTNWHWLIIRDDAASGWQALQSLDDGVLISVATAAHEAWATASNRYIARNGSGNHLDGAIDRMLIGDSRWSDAQVQAVIAGGDGPSGVLARWEFNEIVAGKFLDKSGNSKDATISGAPVITDF